MESPRLGAIENADYDPQWAPRKRQHVLSVIRVNIQDNNIRLEGVVNPYVE